MLQNGKQPFPSKEASQFDTSNLTVYSKCPGAWSPKTHLNPIQEGLWRSSGDPWESAGNYCTMLHRLYGKKQAVKV